MPIAAISSSRRRGLADVDELVDVALLGVGHAERGAASARAVRGSASGRTRGSRAPVARSMSSASTQCADVGWYSNAVPGSQLQRHFANRASRASRSSHSSGRNGACGNPDVWSITCSTVMTSLPFGAELGDVLGDAARRVDRALADQDPHRARDDRLGRGEDDVARVGRGVAERHGRRDPAVARERELARREDAGVDVGLRARDERGEGLLVDSELRGTADGGCVEGRHRGRP